MTSNTCTGYVYSHFWTTCDSVVNHYLGTHRGILFWWQISDGSELLSLASSNLESYNTCWHYNFVFFLSPLTGSRSFVLSSLGFTAVAFVTGSLALWAPAFLYRSRLAAGNLPPCPSGKVCHGDSDRWVNTGSCLVSQFLVYFIFSDSFGGALWQLISEFF